MVFKIPSNCSDSSAVAFHPCLAGLAVAIWRGKHFESLVWTRMRRRKCRTRLTAKPIFFIKLIKMNLFQLNVFCDFVILFSLIAIFTSCHFTNTCVCQQNQYEQRSLFTQMVNSNHKCLKSLII